MGEITSTIDRGRGNETADSRYEEGVSSSLSPQPSASHSDMATFSASARRSASGRVAPWASMRSGDRNEQHSKKVGSELAVGDNLEQP